MVDLRRSAGSVLTGLLACGCVFLERAPGPEDPTLVARARGTLIVHGLGGSFSGNDVRLVDLPSRSEFEVDVPGGWSRFEGLDARGRFIYLFTTPAYTWELRRFDWMGRERAPAVLAAWDERAPWRARPAPQGDCIAVWAEGELQFELLEGEPHVRRALPSPVGAIRALDWLPDGRALVLEGPTQGAILALDGAVLERSELGYGPFSPDGATFLRRAGEAYAWVERATGRELARPARFPWSHQERTTHYGLCGSGLGLYLALPTDGTPVPGGFAVGGAFYHESFMLKVCDLASGAFATLEPLPFNRRVLYSPVRCALPGAAR